VGRVVEIPPPPRADDLAERKLDPADPGFDNAVLGPVLAGIGRPERLVPYGLVAPTSWERRFVAYAARRLEIAPEPGWDAFSLETGGPFDDLARAVADPLAPSPAERDAIALVEAEDPELEAIAAARAIRAWLDPVPVDLWPALVSEVVVLLPSSPARRATWKRILEAHGLAADAPVWRTLAELPVGRWLVALARLSGWASAPVHRDDLRDALLAPMFTLQSGARRSDLRSCLRSLRSHRVHLDDWRAHLAAWTAAAEAGLADDLTKTERAEAVAALKARADGLRKLTDLIAMHLGHGGAAFSRVLAVVEALGARERLQASGVDVAIRAYERGVRILRTLAAGEDAGAGPSPARRLEDVLAGFGMRVEPRPRSGVRLLSYGQYDGRPARVVVLAGLEEGGYPAAPPRLDPDQAKLEAALGLESQDDELLRAARVVGCAAARASERVVLTFSRTDEAGTDTFPGAVLAAVRRRKEGAPGIPATAATEATARPATLADVASPADLLVTSDTAVAPAVAGTALAERWARAAAAAQHLAEIEAERNPAEPTPAGPFTGVVGVDLGATAYSPSSLEKLGQCAFRYFVERILGAEEAADAGVDLDALETGSLLHLALARAAQDAIVEKGAWVLNAPDDEREKHVGLVHAEVSAAIDAAAREVLASNPTLSKALVGHFLGRWKRVLRSWLEAEVRAPIGGAFGPGGLPEPDALDDDALDAVAARTKTAANAVEGLRRVRRAVALVEGARKKALDRDEAADRWKKADTGRLVLKPSFVAAAAEKDAKKRVELLDALRGSLDAVRAEKTEALKAAVQKAYLEDREAVPRRAVASEWSFGDEPDPSNDPKSTDKPLEIALPGGKTIAVRGRVDRVDLAEDRPDAAVVDYKTGRAKTPRVLVREIGEGRHLQLPIYARAVDALLAGNKGFPAKTRTVLGRLDFVRFGTPAQALLEDGAGPELVPADAGGTPVPGKPSLPLQEVVAEHLAHALRRLESGVLPPVPRNCPQTGGMPCPAQVVCGALDASLERILPPEPQPLFVPPPREPSEKKEKPSQEVTYTAARPVPDPPSFEEAKAAHDAGLERARDVGRDVVVSAGAGSGKTTALVDRYVAALRAGARPSEILCITFTRKATAEMRSRVRERIVDLDRAVVAPEDLSRWISELGTAPIRTIDAFAGEIAAELADEAIEASDAAAAFADEFVADRLAAEAEQPSSTLKRLLERLPLAKLKLALAKLVQQDALEDPAVAGHDADGILAAWEAEAKRSAGDLQEQIAKLLAHAEEAVEKADEPSSGLTALRDGLAEAVAAFEKQGVLAGTWAAARVKYGNGRAKDVEALATALKPLRAKARALWVDKAKTTSRCESAAEVMEQVKAEAQLAQAALATARSWLEPYREAKAARGVLSFGDVLAAADRAVRAAPPELLRSRFPFRHVLVDEFQDTNTAQFRFISAVRERLALAAPDGEAPKLFTVGDPKQSIYRFRGAEVDLFERHVQDADARSRATLSVCWRSAPELTRALSRLFGRVFDPELDPEAVVPWEALAPKGNDARGPRVELVRRDDLARGSPTVDDGAAAADDEDAAAESSDGDGDEEEDTGKHEDVERPLVRRMRELLRDANPRPGESPVALLTHSWDRALHYGSLLQQHGIPCFVQGGRGLLATREVVDLLHWLRALERQDDDLCFVGILRGGTIGVSDPGLYCLRQGYGVTIRKVGEDGYAAPAGRIDLSLLRIGFTFDPETALAKLAPKGPSADAIRKAVRADGPRLAAFAAAWERANRQFGVVPLGTVLRGIVEDTGYDAVLHARPRGLQALANVRSFLELVDAVSEGRSPMAAVRELDRIGEAGDDPGASGFTLAAGAAVTVTVVHQAKGREWDVVVIPDLHRVEARDRVELFDLQRVVRRTPKRASVAWVPSAAWESAADLFGVVGGVGRHLLVRTLAGAERAESRRLLYVACTRARERLVLGARWPTADELRAMDPHDPIDLTDATTWLDVVQTAIQLRPGDGDALVPGDGLWVEGRDFAWVRPAGEGYGVVGPPGPAAPATAGLDALRRAARGVPPVPLEIVNPSALKADGLPPPPIIAQPTAVPALGTETPFASKDEEGNAFHRAAQLWSFGGPWDPSIAETAVREAVGPACLAARAARVDEIVRALETGQPALVAELHAAADRGELFHEVDVGFLDAAGRRFEGAIDLLYRDSGGSWHVLDYKTSDIERAGKLGAKIAEYHPQVAAYAEALRGKLPGRASLTSYGLWFVEAGLVARWSA
jgi:ATP-dependent helicase/nuclease subunit A